MRILNITVCTALTVLVFISFAGISFSENIQEKSLTHNHLKKRLTDKYKKIQEVSSTLHDTPNGPQSHISIGGEIKPGKTPIVEGQHAWERGMAKGFIEQEATTFGITNMDEIQERYVHSSIGYYGEITNVYFNRVINSLVLENSDINITVDTTRNISSIIADVVPVSPELYEATKKNTLSEDRIKNIIEDNMKVSGSKGKVKINKIEKLATSTPPYVIWTADVLPGNKTGRWKFRINAFTGEIIEKKDALIRNRR